MKPTILVVGKVESVKGLDTIRPRMGISIWVTGGKGNSLKDITEIQIMSIMVR